MILPAGALILLAYLGVSLLIIIPVAALLAGCYLWTASWLAIWRPVRNWIAEPDDHRWFAGLLFWLVLVALLPFSSCGDGGALGRTYWQATMDRHSKAMEWGVDRPLERAMNLYNRKGFKKDCELEPTTTAGWLSSTPCEKGEKKWKRDHGSTPRSGNFEKRFWVVLIGAVLLTITFFPTFGDNVGRWVEAGRQRAEERRARGRAGGGGAGGGGEHQQGRALWVHTALIILNDMWGHLRRRP